MKTFVKILVGFVLLIMVYRLIWASCIFPNRNKTALAIKNNQKSYDNIANTVLEYHKGTGKKKTIYYVSVDKQKGTASLAYMTLGQKKYRNIT